MIFKGSGFYITDYRSEKYKEAAKKDIAPASAPAAADKPASGGESKPAPAKADDKPAKAPAKKTRLMLQSFVAASAGMLPVFVGGLRRQLPALGLRTMKGPASESRRFRMNRNAKATESRRAILLPAKRVGRNPQARPAPSLRPPTS